MSTTKTPPWRMTRTLPVDAQNLSVFYSTDTLPKLEITEKGDTTLNTPVTVNGTLTATGTVKANGDVSIVNSLTVTGMANMNGGLGVGRNLTVTGSVKVDGGITGNGAVPPGVIVMWSGDGNRVPPGWALCDGQNGRPDLRGRFPVGADNHAFHPNTTGGRHSHTHTVTASFKLHSSRNADGKEFGIISPDTIQTITGKALEENHVPPYYGLHFIIKLDVPMV